MSYQSSRYHELFEYITPLGLFVDRDNYALICYHDKCKRAIRVDKGQPSTHVASHGIPRAARVELARLLRRVDVRNPDSLAPLKDGGQKHPYLRPYDGYICRKCDTRTTDLQLIRKHNPLYGKGSCPAIDFETNSPRSDDHIEYVYLQSWSRHKNRRYWIVEHDGSLIRATGSNPVQDHLNSVKAREGDRSQASVDLTARDLSLAEESSWLDRTDWVDMLRGRDRGVLSAMIDIRRPGVEQPHVLASGGTDGEAHAVVISLQDERRITSLLALVDTMMDRCEQTARKTSRNILCWVRSIKPLTSYQKPFKLVRQPGTTKKYRYLLKKFLAFVLRAYRLDPLVRKRLTRIRMSKKLNRLLERVWHNNYWDSDGLLSGQGSSAMNSELIDPALVADIDGISVVSSGVENGDTDEETDEETDDEDGNEVEDTSGFDDNDDTESSDIGNAFTEDNDDATDSAAAMAMETTTANTSHQDATDEVLELLFGLTVALFEERPVDGRLDSMLVVLFSATLGYSATRQSFLQAREFTTHLSGLIYVQRLVLLEHAPPVKAYPRLGFEARPRINQLQRLNKVRKRFLVTGPQSSFDEFFSLLNFGRGAAELDSPPFLLYWSDDGQSVSWEGSLPLTMFQFRQLSSQLILEAERLCRELMYGLEPTVDLESLKDNLANKQQGYSFVSEPANNLHESYLELSRRACIAAHGSLSHKGGWKWKAVDGYLKTESRFRIIIGLLMQETGGQAARWSELLALLCENSDTGQRGLFAFKSQIMYITRHHKAKRSTNREFIVARFLPAAPSRILYKYLTYIRPFADLLHRERYRARLLPSSEGSGTSKLLFRKQSGLESKAWTSSAFNTALKRETVKCWSQAVNSKIMRQLRIGITDKHVREVYEPLNRYDDRSPNAHRNAIFAHQSGHRPRQRGTNYGLDGAFPTKMQPQLLELYGWASSRWHEFLQLPSKPVASPSGESIDAVTSDDETPDANDQPQDIPTTAPSSPTPARQSPTWPNADARLLGSNWQDSVTRSQRQGPVRQHESQTSHAEPSDVLLLKPVLDECATLPTIIGDTSTADLVTLSLPQSPIVIDSDTDSETRCTFPTVGPIPSGLHQTLVPSAERGDTSECPDIIFGLDPAATYDIQKELNSFNKFLHEYVTTRQSIDLMHERLSRMLQTTKWWSSLSCPLCFLCGDMEAEHTLRTCKRDKLHRKAISIMRWLDDLRIPQRIAEGTRACSLCLTFCACGEGVATTGILHELYSEGRCEIKPIVCMAIASLAAYDNDLFRNMLYKVPMTTDAEVWFETRIPYDGRWFSNLLLAYEEIMLGFYFRRNTRRGKGPMCDFPYQPPASAESQVIGSASPRLNTQEEVTSWEAAIGWWEGKCSFCTGHGLNDQDIQHTLRLCTRGGSEALRGQLAVVMYEEGVLPSFSCDTCHLPYDFCDDWTRADGEWLNITTAKGVLCQFTTTS